MFRNMFGCIGWNRRAPLTKLILDTVNNGSTSLASWPRTCGNLIVGCKGTFPEFNSIPAYDRPADVTELILHAIAQHPARQDGIKTLFEQLNYSDYAAAEGTGFEGSPSNPGGMMIQVDDAQNVYQGAGSDPDRLLLKFTSRTQFGSVTDGLSNTLAVGEKSAKNTMTTWVGVIPGSTWRSANDTANYGGIPSNIAAAKVLGHACRQHPPSADAGVAEDFSSPHNNGVNMLFADGSVHSVRTSVNMGVYPFTASTGDGMALAIDCGLVACEVALISEPRAAIHKASGVPQ